MAVILIASNDFEDVFMMSGTVESLGHKALPLLSTENLVEDVLFNKVEMVLVTEGLQPFSGWESCEILRGDPTVPERLPILMLVHGPGNVRRLEQYGFTGTLDPGASSAELGEAIVRELGDRAAPADLDALAELDLE